MTDLPIITRRDLLGEHCLFCDTGVYREDRFSILTDDRVECTTCRAVIDRWLTKREVLQLQAEKVNIEDDK